ncbi:thioredoxin family protein [Rhodococcus sp. D2-41]|uniref:Thioredoxin family protein n=1 Tax=Speluncibacter jeojiensis TaxID=2710754 RepID=A0A9X4LZF7_9ACTN|nr:thioredoxin family protein [Rhodococcus sp. D2-41]MDG3011604.1 thioredoxin family protein [Rhodococcus sp. D2-41]MDG3015039.1 thioredoxin family protein [Corynebacteriales bacterium D3-21]
MIPLIVLAVAVVIAVAVGLVLRQRAGRVRAGASPTGGVDADDSGLRGRLVAAGVSTTGPTVLHFSADWCGPCAGVRRAVAQVVRELGVSTGAQITDLELDIDEHPALAKELGVHSLPTTFLYDAAGAQRHRISGVPAIGDLRDALRPLCGTDEPPAGTNG